MDTSTALGSSCRVVHPGDPYDGKQGPSYTPGVSNESCGARGIWLGMVTIAPMGRTRAHYHAGHESAFYVVSGELELRYSDWLRERDVARAGDYLYIPAGVSHVAPLSGANGGIARHA